MSDSSETGLVIFGRDVTKVPCFRNSFLYGISGGLACGLAGFMVTSRPKTGTNVAVGAFVMITMGYWVACRYRYAQQKFEMQQTRYLLQQHTILEGTAKEQEFRKSLENEAKDAKYI